jgi:hypothetical protein
VKADAVARVDANRVARPPVCTRVHHTRRPNALTRLPVTATRSDVRNYANALVSESGVIAFRNVEVAIGASPGAETRGL